MHRDVRRFNDPQAKLGALGGDQDRNVELVLPAPFALRAAGVEARPSPPAPGSCRPTDTAAP